MVRALIVKEMLLMCDIIAAALEDEDDLDVIGLTTSAEEAMAAA